MKILITVSIFVSFICFKLNVFSQTIYRSHDPQFRIEIPKDWEVKTPKGPNIKFSMASINGSSVNVMLQCDKSLVGYNAWDFGEEDVTSDLKGFPDYKTLKFEKTKVNLERALLLKAQWRWQSMGVDELMVNLMCVIVHDDCLYYITCGSGKSRFNIDEALFNDVISSFVIEEDYHKSKLDEPVEPFVSIEDNFRIRFKNDPNIDYDEGMSTYSATSIKDTAVFRITVYEDNLHISNIERRKEYEKDFLDEYANNLQTNHVPYVITSFKDHSAIIFGGESLVYGEIQSFGVKGYWKGVIFIHKNKIYTISVVCKKANLESLFKEFADSYANIN